MKLTTSLNPAPISPYTIDSPAWRLLSGTTKGTYNSRPVKEEGQSKMIQMAPSYSTGVSHLAVTFEAVFTDDPEYRY